MFLHPREEKNLRQVDALLIEPRALLGGLIEASLDFFLRAKSHLAAFAPHRIHRNHRPKYGHHQLFLFLIIVVVRERLFIYSAYLGTADGDVGGGTFFAGVDLLSHQPRCIRKF